MLPKMVYDQNTRTEWLCYHFCVCFFENCLRFCSCSYFTFEIWLHSLSDEAKMQLCNEPWSKCKNRFSWDLTNSLLFVYINCFTESYWMKTQWDSWIFVNVMEQFWEFPRQKLQGRFILILTFFFFFSQSEIFPRR